MVVKTVIGYFLTAPKNSVTYDAGEILPAARAFYFMEFYLQVD